MKRPSEPAVTAVRGSSVSSWAGVRKPVTCDDNAKPTVNAAALMGHTRRGESGLTMKPTAKMARKRRSGSMTLACAGLLDAAHVLERQQAQAQFLGVAAGADGDEHLALVDARELRVAFVAEQPAHGRE